MKQLQKSILKGTKPKQETTNQRYQSLKEQERQALRCEVAPKGGVIARSRYLEVMNGYITYVAVTDFPFVTPALWQKAIKPLDGEVIIGLDPKLDQDIKINLNNTMSELNDQLEHCKSSTKINELQKRIDELQPLIDLANSNEVFARLNITIKLKAPTLEELQRRVEQFIEELNKFDFDGTVFLDEQLDEMKQLLIPCHSRKKHRKGHIVPMSAMAGGYFPTVREHHDWVGTFIGFDEDGNPVLFNPFFKLPTRPNSNGFVAGGSGSGKSTFLFRLMKNHLMLGDRVRVIDPVGDFVRVMEDLGGITLALDGTSEFALNPLAMVLAVDEDQNVMQETLNKAETWLSLALPSLDAVQLSIFKKTLKSLYEAGAKEVILSDVLEQIQDRLNEKKDPDEIISLLHRMVILLEGLIDSTESLFNRRQQINTFEMNGICFTMRNLMSYGSNIIQAQFYNVLHYLWQELIVLGTPEKIKAQKGVPKTQLTETLLLIDESHHFINLKNLESIATIQLIQRENRKYEGGLWFATQSILDFVKSANDSASESLKQLFSFCEYNAIFNEKANAKPVYTSLLGHRLTVSQIDEISSLSQGEFFLNIGSNSTLKVDSYGTYSESDLSWMGGGA